MITQISGVLAFLMLLAIDPALAHHVMDGAMPATFRQGLLSGLGHPVIGLDHLAAVIVVGCLAATQPRGALLVVGYVAATMIGAAAHIGEATVPNAEVFVALSVVALGLVVFRSKPLRRDLAFALFAGVGLVNGYALGESIAGAEPTPLLAYFAGLAAIQTAIALAVMFGMRWLAGRASLQLLLVRAVGAFAISVGAMMLLQRYATGA
jgi:urease accessory protein